MYQPTIDKLMAYLRFSPNCNFHLEFSSLLHFRIESRMVINSGACFIAQNLGV